MESIRRKNTGKIPERDVNGCLSRSMSPNTHPIFFLLYSTFFFPDIILLYSIMRNLSLVASTSSALSLDSATISCTAIDLDQNITYIASERGIAGANVEVKIWKAVSDEKVVAYSRIHVRSTEYDYRQLVFIT